MALSFQLKVLSAKSVKAVDALIEERKQEDVDLKKLDLNFAYGRKKQLEEVLKRGLKIPKVVYVNPHDSATKIDPAITFVYVSFSHKMDTTTTEAAFSLTGTSSGAVSGALTWSNNDKTLTFTFSNLTADDEYILLIDKSSESYGIVKFNDGHTMARNFESTFKTE